MEKNVKQKHECKEKFNMTEKNDQIIRIALKIAWRS